MMITFFYNKLTAAGAIGKFDSTNFTTTKVFKERSFGNWTHVIRIPQSTPLPPKEHTLLFYDAESGAGAIGTVGTDSFVSIKDNPPGSFGTWTHIAATGSYLLFYDQNTGSANVTILDNQGIQTIKEYAPGSFGTWTHVASVGNQLLFYNGNNGAGSIGKLTGQGFITTKEYPQGSFGTWSHIATAGIYLFFYNSNTGAGSIGKPTDQGIATLKDFPAGSFGSWTHIVEGDTIWAKSGDGAESPVTHKPLLTFAEDGAHLLFYDLVSGKGALGELRNGDFETTKLFSEEAFGKWTQVANCTADLASTTGLIDAALRHLVAKSIQTEYRRRGGNLAAGLLGAPVGAITHTATGEYVQNYQFGQIRQPITTKSLMTKDLDLPLTQSDYVADIFLAAIKCFGTEDDGFVGIGGNGDEPYFIATSINPAPAWLGGGANGVVQTVRTEIFENITEGRIFAEERRLFTNVPLGAYGIQLKLALFEHESGDPEDLRKRIQEQGEALAKELIDLVAAMMGLNIDEAAADQALDSTLGKLVQDVTFDLLTDWLKDDKIDEKNVLINAAMLKDWYDNGKTATSDIPNHDLPSHIRFNFPRNFEDPYWVFSGGGGSYKVYLRVIPKRITITPEKTNHD